MNPANFYQLNNQTPSQFDPTNNNNKQTSIPSNRSTWSILPESNQALKPFHSLSIKPFQQALFTTYPSRLRLGTTSLVQPIITNTYIQQRTDRAHSPLDHHHHHHTNTLGTSHSSQFHLVPGSVSDLGRRTRKVVNYSEHDSKLPEFELETSLDERKPLTARQKAWNVNQSTSSSSSAIKNSSSHQTFNNNITTNTTNTTVNEIDEKKKELEALKKRKYGDGKIYLDLEPPAKLIKVQKRIRKPIGIMNLLSLDEKNEGPPEEEDDQDLKEKEKEEGDGDGEDRLVPIRIEFDTEEIRVRDVFTWNLSEKRISPETFAIEFCHDLDISPVQYVPKIIEQINFQLKEFSTISNLKLLPNQTELDQMKLEELEGIEPDLRVIINLDVQIQTLHLVDKIEWDLASNLTPELFTKQYISELSLPTSSLPIISHCIHEEIFKYKKECVSIGLISKNYLHSRKHQAHQNQRFESSDPLLRERFSLQKGCRRLEGVWRDWNECNLFGPKVEYLNGEDLEWIEIEKERLIRRARRETARVGRRR